MLIAKNNEEKRSMIWRITVLAATAIIILVALFFITDVFVSNPLKGSWISEDNGMEMEVKKDNIFVTLGEPAEAEGISVTLGYELDKSDKVVTIHVDQAALEEAIQNADTELSMADLEMMLDTMTTTFNYSVDRGELTLTEREYGEQMVFMQK